MKPGTLTPLQEQFIVELLKTPSEQAESYRRACVALNRKVPKSAHVIANETANHPLIKSELDKRRKARAARLELKTDDILAELMEMRNVDAADITPWTETGCSLIPSAQLTKAQRLMVKKVRIRTHRWMNLDGSKHEETNTELEMHDTVKIRELIGRHMGLWEGDGSPKGTTYMLLVQQLKIELTTKTTDELRELASKLGSLKAVKSP